MSSTEEICNKLRNPFIKDTSTEIYNISDKMIENIRETYLGTNESTKEEKLQKLKIFKKSILPKIMNHFKNQYTNFNMYNAHAMELLLISNTFKQFNDLYFNREFFPELDGINQLIENKNSTPENGQTNEIDSLYNDIETSENTYFEKNKIYKENILRFITALSKKYFSEFRAYADFQTTKSIVELNTLTSYANFLKTVPKLLKEKNKDVVQKEINKYFNTIITIFPSSVYELFPREIDDFINNGKDILNKNILNNMSKNVPINRNGKIINLVKTIQKIIKIKKYFSITALEDINNQETHYKNIITKYNEIIKIEQKEEVLFKDLQSNRTKLNNKIREIGKGIQDKKYSQLVSEFKNSYTAYNTTFYEKLKLYKNLDDFLNSPPSPTTPTTPTTPTSSTTTSGNRPDSSFDFKKFDFKTFELNHIFKNIFESIIIQTNSKKLISSDETTLRNNVYTYLYQETNKGIDDIKLEILRNQDKRNIYDFTLNMNELFEQDIHILNNEIQNISETKEKVSREINILESMVTSATQQVSNKQSYTQELTSEKTKLETEITTLSTAVSRKKTTIDNGLTNIKIQNAFGNISFNDIPKLSSIDELQEKYMIKHNKSYKEAILDKIFEDIDKLIITGRSNMDIKNMFVNTSPVADKVNMLKYRQIDPTSLISSSSISSIEDKIRNFISVTLMKKIDDIVPQNPSGSMTTAPILANDTNSNEIKNFLKEFITTGDINDMYNKFYESERSHITTKDTKFKEGKSTFESLTVTYNEYFDDNNKLTKNREDISRIINELREIREGPEEYKSQLNAKKTFDKRLEQQYNELKSLFDKKEKSNKELQELIGSESFKTLLNELYGALIARYKSIYSLIKKQIIQSEVYNIFCEDNLYKSIKSLYDVLSSLYKNNSIDNNNLSEEFIVEVIKSFQTFVTKRLEEFPQVSAKSKSEGEIKFKKYQIQSIGNILKGQKYGNYQINPNTNMKSFASKVKDQNVDNLLSLLQNVHSKQISFNQIDKSKLKYYVETYGTKVSQPINQQKVASSITPNPEETLLKKNNIQTIPINNKSNPVNSKPNPVNSNPVNSKPNPINSNPIANPIILQGGSNNKKNKLISLNRNSKVKSFMTHIYNILLEENSKSSNDFVERLKNYEYKLLNQAKSKIRTFTYLYGRMSKKGSDKIKNHLLYIYNMAKICLDDFDKELTEIFKRGKSTNKRINILLISKYIYMEMIMIYTLSYFC